MSEARKSENPSDRCRVCRCHFKVKFGTASQPGKAGYISSENLFRPSKRKDTYGEILADTCRAVGVEVVENTKLFSERVCNPCARKIRNLGTLYEFVRSIGRRAGACETPPKQSINVSKRLLETPPGSSPCRKTVRVNSPVSKKASRKSLQFATTEQSAQKDCVESKLNIDDLPTDGTLQIKVVIVDSTGQVTTRIPHEEESKQIVRQLCNKNWQAAANTILKHKELKPEVVKALKKNVSEELTSYTKAESILLLNEPDEIASFSNTIFLEEVRVFCPVFYEFVVASSGQDDQEMKKAGIGTNGVAFAAATLCRVRNPKASALHYRISTVLFHSGTKHEDLVRLNRLGMCMSPDVMIRAQRKMGEQLEAKVKVWKKAIEENKAALLLCEEIEKKQIPARDYDDMEIAVNLELAEETLKNYDNFTDEGFRLLMKTTDTAREKLCDASYTEECLSEAAKKLLDTTPPLYR